MKLFIDSSTSYLYLAILSDKGNYSYMRYGKNDHSETLVDFLELFLKEHNIKLDDISQICIGRGPGSYTGLRIAGTVGKVLAYTKDKTFKSFSSLDLLLASVINEDGKYLIKTLAKKNHSYIKAVEIKNNIINIITPDSFVCDDELTKYSEYKVIEVSDELFKSPCLAKNLYEHNLLQEESKYEYVPNYLRSGI